ncbi:hypothetical protein Q1695_004650 [Nippostrongylus brasiliensis]|nr:hypothetical protein Q1695_004650 [Nippostrongylus brasiliensis]
MPSTCLHHHRNPSSSSTRYSTAVRISLSIIRRRVCAPAYLNQGVSFRKNCGMDLPDDKSCLNATDSPQIQIFRSLDV